MYEYSGTVTRIRDGDTIEVDLDLGLYIHTRIALRLLDVDAPEVVGATRSEGFLATEYIASLIPVGSTVRVQTFKRPNGERYVQTFDRFVARVWTGEIDVNEAMRVWLAPA